MALVMAPILEKHVLVHHMKPKTHFPALDFDQGITTRKIYLGCVEQLISKSLCDACVRTRAVVPAFSRVHVAATGV